MQDEPLPMSNKTGDVVNSNNVRNPKSCPPTIYYYRQKATYYLGSHYNAAVKKAQGRGNLFAAGPLYCSFRRFVSVVKTRNCAPTRLLGPS